VRLDVDENASGTVVYSIKALDREFNFIGFSRPLNEPHAPDV
jgi:hypothetical protein